jgi:hypothetical protein
MQHLRRHCSLGLCALAVFLFLGAGAARGQSAASDTQSHLQCPDPKFPLTPLQAAGCYYGDLYLRNTSYDIAAIVCLKDDVRPCRLHELIERLGKMKKRCVTEAADDIAEVTKALIWRQEISETVLTASLQVDGFLAEVDSESARIRAAHDGLTDQRDKAVGHSTLWTNLGTGGGAVGSALALGSQMAMTAGGWVGAVSGGVGTLFSFLGYHQAAGPKGCFPEYKRDSKSKDAPCDDLKKPIKTMLDKDKDPCGESGSNGYGCSPSMLSFFLFKIDPGFHSIPDPIVKTYLTDRRSGLMGQWGIDQSQINALTNPGDNTIVKKEDQPIEALITRNESRRKLSIDDLTDRANKLADLRAVASILNRDLSRLTEDLATGLRCKLQ